MSAAWLDAVVADAAVDLDETGDSILTFEHPPVDGEELRRGVADKLAERGWAADVEVDVEQSETVLLIQAVRVQ